MKTFIFLLAFFFSISCRAQSGMYLPSINPVLNCVVYSVDSAHFIRVDDQVYVYGKFQIRNSDSLSQVILKISTPYALRYNVKNPSAGNCFIFGSGFSPIVGSCLSSFADGGKIQLYYVSPVLNIVVVDYFFIYSVKN